MDILSDLFGAAAQSAGTHTLGELVFAIGLSFALTMVIGTVYKSTHRGTIYTQDFVHTLIMLGTVVTVIILGIGDNVAAAFGLFAAFSIIRFRRALPEARDVGFVFLTMAVGLACGAERYALAILTTAMVSTFVVVLSRFDLFAPERPSHRLRVRVTNDIDYDAAFAEPFATLLDHHTLLSVESVQAGMMTELTYAVRLAEGVSEGTLVAELQQRNGNNRILLTRIGLFDVED